jgi:hypothetical protein
MSGICFFKSESLKKIKEFYLNRIGMKLWLDQGSCVIFRDDKFLLGFCEAQTVESNGIITFFFETQKEVDDIYGRIKDISDGEPRVNEKYNIYQFFAKDPEDRTLEFQVFLHDLDWRFERGSG